MGIREVGEVKGDDENTLQVLHMLSVNLPWSALK